MILTLKGFQSHEETALDLRGNLVCLTGPNNVGKSSAVRAALWLFYDALRGSKFVRKGSDLASVSLEDGPVTVVREKGRKTSSANRYSVCGKAFDSIGTGAPPEAEEALGVRRARIDKDLELELNVVRQKEHPFLMEETGTAKAKILNALTGLHVLDVAIRQTANLLRSAKSDEKSLAAQRDGLALEADGFGDVPVKESVVSQARAQVERLMERAERTRRARQELAELDLAKRTRSSLSSAPSPDMASLEKALARHEELLAKVSAARAALSSLASAKASLESLRSSPLGAVDCAPAEQALARHEFLLAKRDELVKARNAKSSLALDVRDLQVWSASLDKAVSDLKAMAGSRCSECGQTLTEACLAEAA